MCYVSCFNANDEDFRCIEFPLVFNTNHEANTEITEEETNLIKTYITTLEADMKKVSDLKQEIQEYIYNATTAEEMANNITTLQQSVSDIKEEQVIQNNNIENLQAENEEKTQIIAEQKEEIEELREDLNNSMLSGEAEGETITLEDSANQRIKSLKVSGNSEQETRKGYNLLPTSQWAGSTFSHNGVDFKVLEDGSISIKGTLTSTTADGLIKGSWGSTKEILELEEGESYTLQLVGNSSSNIAVYLINVSTVITYTKTSTTFSASLNPTMLFVRFSGNVGDTINTIVYPQLVKGSSAKETYEKYGSMPSSDYPSEVKTVNSSVEIKVCNENRFDMQKWINSKVLAVHGTIDNITDKEITLTATANDCYTDTYGGSTDAERNRKVIKNYGYVIEENTDYTLAFKKANNTAGYSYAFCFDKDGNYINRTLRTNGGILNFTTPENAKYLMVRFGINASGNTETFSDIMILKGTYTAETLPNYIEHKEQSFTMPTQKEMLEDDYFDLETNEEVHKLKKIELTGQENFVYYCTSNFSVFYSDILAGLVNNSKYICTHFKKGIYTTTNNVIQITYTGRIHLRNDDYTDVSEFKSWLAEQYEAGTPVTIYYKLAEEERLEFTDEQLAVAKEIKKAKTYKNITHIFSNNDISPTFKVEYYKDLETVINNMQAQILAGEE